MLIIPFPLFADVKGKVTLSHSHGCELTNGWIESWRAVLQLPPSTRPISLDHGLQVYLQTRSIMASKCISKLARSRPPSTSPNSLNHGLQVRLQTRSITASMCISKLTRLRPPSESTDSLDYGLQVRTIMASKCISKLARSRPPSASLNSLDPGLQVYLCISKKWKRYSEHSEQFEGF